MKAIKYIFAALAVVLLAAACQKSVIRTHDDLRGEKILTVADTSYVLGWQKDTIILGFKANCLWGLEFLSWTDQATESGDTVKTMSSAKWMSTPVIYGQGDAVTSIVVEANSKSKLSREGYIRVFTGDENVCKLLSVRQAGNPDAKEEEELLPKELYFNFVGNTMGWPTTAQTIQDNLIYNLDGVDYNFCFGRCNIGNYLVVHNAGAYFGLPALEKYKLVKVTIHVPSSNKKARGSSITEDTAGLVVVGADQTWPAQGGNQIVYDLEGTKVNTRYYIMCTLLGLPIDAVTLNYEPVK